MNKAKKRLVVDGTVFHTPRVILAHRVALAVCLLGMALLILNGWATERAPAQRRTATPTANTVRPMSSVR